MTFLRVKRRGGARYAYLVANAWDPMRQQPRQRVIRYLGRLDALRADDVPEEYRTPAVLGALARRGRAESSRRREALERLRAPFLEAVLSGDLSEGRRAVRSATRLAGVGAVYDDLIPGALHTIGDRWAERRLSVAQEHLATGVIARLLHELNSSARFARATGPSVVLAVPEGEPHTIPLDLAEGLLLRRGYRVQNLGRSVPDLQLAEFVRVAAPAALLVSVTLPERLGRARTLIGAVRHRAPSVRIALGGRALLGREVHLEGDTTEVVRESLAAFLARWPAERPAEPPRGVAVPAVTSRRSRGPAARASG